MRAAVRSLQAEGLVEVEEVMGGRAEAFKTVRRGGRHRGWQQLALGGGRPRPRSARSSARPWPPWPARRGRGAPGLRERGVGADVVERLGGGASSRIRREQVDRDPFESSAVSATD